jgi:hypothetical protein
VSEAPGWAKGTGWLVRNHAVSILPAVSSLKALRITARPSRAEKPVIGFGNPLLEGSDARYAELARQAREKQSCPQQAPQRLAGDARLNQRLIPFAIRGLANPAELRRQSPLLETADELCTVARQTGAIWRRSGLGLAPRSER